MTDFPSYAHGAVTIEAGATVATFDSAVMSGGNARGGDLLKANGHVVDIVDVIDDFRLKIDPWPYDAVSATDYKIVKCSPLRFVGGQAMADVSSLVARINTQGLVWTLPPGVHSPDGYVAEEGQYIEDTSTREKWKLVSGAWVSQGISDPVFSRYDFAVDVPARPASNFVVKKWVVPSLVTFREGLVESAANADAAATNDATFSLTKNGVEFATFTFASGTHTAAFECEADTEFVKGDVLRCVSPPRDETLADIAITIVAFR